MPKAGVARPPFPIAPRPVAVAVTPELAWVLGRAFGPVGAPWGEALDGGAAVTLATRLGVVSRIADRWGPERLRDDLGPDAAEEAVSTYRREAVAATRLLALARLVCRVAAREGIRAVPLKFAALCLSGAASPASRPAADVDLLVADEDAPRLVAALAADGFLVSDGPAYAHQHPPLLHPRGGMLELHRTIPGVRLSPGTGEARLEDVVREGLVREVAGEPGGDAFLVPVPALLAAHALAHGIYQHGLEPAAYPPLRMLADLQDLARSAAAEAEADVPAADEALAAALPLVAAEVAAEDARAAWALPGRLAREGGRAVLTDPESREARLLGHFLRGALDPEYARSLKLRSISTLPSDRRGPLGLLRQAWDAVALEPAQTRKLYGAKTRTAHIAALALRPFHLAAKLVRYALAAARQSRRER